MNRSILVAGDAPDLSDAVRRAAAARGWQVLRAATAGEAIAALGRDRPAVVLVDAALPDGRGLDLVARIRGAGYREPVCLVTTPGTRSEALSRRQRGLGILHGIERPLDPERLARWLEPILSGDLELSDRSASGSPEQLLASLGAEYARALPERLATLVESVEAARSRRQDAVALDRAILEAHRLRGTAGSYGFPGVSDAARRLEESLQAARETTPDESAWDQIESRVASTLREAENAVRLPSPLPAFSSWEGRVLVVDDDPEFLEFARGVGRTIMVEIVAARDRLAALTVAGEVHPDAAILDVRFGGGEAAFELARGLREVPGCENLPLAFVAVDGSLDHRVAASHAGASLYLEKPVDATALAEGIQHLVSLRLPAKPRILAVDDDPAFCAWVAAVLGGTECPSRRCPTRRASSRCSTSRPPISSFSTR